MVLGKERWREIKVTWSLRDECHSEREAGGSQGGILGGSSEKRQATTFRKLHKDLGLEPSSSATAGLCRFRQVT